MTKEREAHAGSALSNVRWEFHRAQDFDRFTAQWDDLNAAASGSPVLTAPFIASLLREFGSPGELLAVGYCGTTAQAIVVLHRKSVGLWETFQPAQAPLGAWIHRPPHTLEAFIPSLLAALPGVAVALGVTQQDPELVLRPADSSTVETLDYVETARVTVAGTFDEYWAKRGKNLRNNTKKQRTRLEKDGTTLRLDTVTSADEVAQAIAEYGRLESAGWKAAGGTAIHPDNAQGRFYRAMLEDFCRRGAGRIYRYRYGDLIVAMDLCITNGDTLIVLKTTYDESIRDSSPASLMRHEYFRNIFEEARVGRIEFYGKVMDWHTKWSDEIRVLYHANFYRSALALSLHHVLRRRSAQPPAAVGDSAAAGAVKAPVSGQSHQLSVYAALSALPAHSQALFSGAGRTSLFYTLPWYQNFVQTVLPKNERLRIYAVDNAAQQPAARALLVMRYAHTGAGWFEDRTLSGLSNYYTSMFGPVITPDGLEVTQALDTLAAAIAGDEIRWDVVDMHPLATDAPVFAGLLNAFRKAGLLTQPYFCFGNWYLEVGGRSYAEYFDTRPSQLRSTITRKRHQFERSAGSRMVIYRDEAGLDEGLRAYEQIYAASWKVPEPYPEFIRGLCRTCAKAGWLRLAVAYVDNEPAAAQIWIVNDGTASIYKLAYDERFARFSLGTILTAYLMEHVIDVDKVTVVDYLTGDDAYKKDWMSDRRERWGIVAFNLRTVRGALAAARHLGARGAKQALRAVQRLGGMPN